MAAGRRGQDQLRAMTRCARLVVGLLVLALPVAPARAAHPFLTEDPGTQGKGRAELELGFAADQGDPTYGGRGLLFSPQISYGLADNLDFIVQGFWQSQSPAGAPTVRGIGNTLVDLKGRLYEADGPLALAVRAGVDLPTGDDATGIGGGEMGMHVLGIAGWQYPDFSVYANAGYALVRQPGTRRNIGFFSVAVSTPEDAPWRTFIEAAAYSNTDPARTQWPALARTGIIYKVTNGLDVDVGVQLRLDPSATRVSWLAGATWHW
jgi:hypothetical protein